MPSSWVSRVLKAAFEPPRDTGPSLEAMSTTSAPSSTAEVAVTRPPTPAPMTKISQSTVSVISLSSIGSGGISKFHFAFVNFSASKMSSPSPVDESSPCPFGAQPESPRVPAAMAAAPAMPAPFKKLRRSMFVLVIGIPSFCRPLTVGGRFCAVCAVCAAGSAVRPFGDP